MKIDVSTIDGYAEMTAEEKLSALENYEVQTPAPTEEITRLKEELAKSRTSLSKSNTEAAEYKRQLRAKMTEDEQREAQRNEQETALREELETLRKDKIVSSYRTAYLSMGYDPELASETATAMADNDTAKVFENQAKFNEIQKQKYASAALDRTPQPTPGRPPEASDFDSLSDEEYYKKTYR